MGTPAFEHDEARYRMLMENLSDVIWTVDMEMHPTYITPSVTQLLGYSVAEAMKIPPEKILTPDSSDLAMKTFSKDMAKIPKGRKPAVSRHRTLELDMIRKDGTIVPVEGRLTFRRDSNGHPVEIVAMMRDITKRKRAEEDYKLLFESIPDDAFVLDRDWRYVVTNRSSWDRTSFSKDNLIGNRIMDVYPNITETPLWQSYIDAMEKRIPVRTEAEFTFDTGECGWYEMRMLPIPEGILVISRDITKRKRVEKLIEARTSLITYAVGHTMEEVLRKTLDDIGDLVESPIGFYHFVNPDQKNLTLQAWSTRTLKEFCRAEGNGRHYPISQAGVWVDCVRQRKPVIHNDYASLPHRKGMPEGHARIVRELVVPIMRQEKIVAILGVGNKPSDYTAKDVEMVTYLADVAWEVAEIKHAEETFKEERDKAQQYLNIAGVMIVAINTEGEVTLINRKGCEILGYEESEIIGKKWFDCFVPERIKHDLKEVSRELLDEEGKSVEYHENPVLTKSGQERIISWHNTVLRDANGQIMGHLSSGEDITDRKQAEEDLRESEAFLNTLLNAIPIPVFYKDPEGKYIGFNKAFEDFFGETKEQLVGKSVFDINPPDLAEIYHAKDRELMESAGVQKYESQVENASGDRREVIFNKAAFHDHKGTLGGLIGAVLDITERKRAEEIFKQERDRAQLYLDIAGVLIIAINTEGETILINRKGCEILGYEESEIIGKIWTDHFIPERSRNIVAKNLRELLDGQESAQYYEGPVLTKSGEERTILWHATIVRDENNKITEFLISGEDITERKQMEREIRRQNEKFQLINMELQASREELKINLKEVAEARAYSEALIRSIGEGLLMIDFDGIVRDTNEVYLDLSGFKREEVVGQPMKINTIATEEGRQEAIERFRRAKAGEQVGVTEIGFFGGRGEMIHLEVNRNLVRDAEGNPFMILVTMRDITERKRMEQEIRRQNEKLQLLNMELKTSQKELRINLAQVAEARAYNESLIRSLNDGFLVLDSDGTVLDANDALFQITGLNREDFIGHPLVVEKHLSQEDWGTGWQRVKSFKSGIEVPDIELPYRRPDGTEITLSISNNIVRDASGNPIRLLMVLKDITERKRAEREIRQRNQELEALNKIAAAVSQSYDLDQIMENALGRIMEISGMESGAIIQPDEAGNIVFKTHHGISRKIRNAFGGVKIDAGLLGIAAKSGRPILVEDVANDPRVEGKAAIKNAELKTAVYVPLRAKKKLLGMLIISSKEPRQVSPAELQLLETIGDQLGMAMENARLMHEVTEVDALREVDRLRSQLLSTVSHELRTPLATIKGYACMLLEYDAKINPDEKRQHLESIDKASNRLTDLIDQLLDTARMEAGRLQMPKSPTDISELIQAAAAEATVRAPDHRIEVKIAEPLPQVSINAKQIRRVLDNLIDNAIKYSMPGTRVTISAAQEGQELAIGVEDQGIGISAKDLPKIFEPMYRADSPLSVKAGGVGLGLSISKALVEAHNGRIWMRGKKRKGSTCYFTLPLYEETEPSQK